MSLPDSPVANDDEIDPSLDEEEEEEEIEEEEEEEEEEVEEEVEEEEVEGEEVEEDEVDEEEEEEEEVVEEEVEEEEEEEVVEEEVEEEEEEEELEEIEVEEEEEESEQRAEEMEEEEEEEVEVEEEGEEEEVEEEEEGEEEEVEEEEEEEEVEVEEEEEEEEEVEVEEKEEKEDEEQQQQQQETVEEKKEERQQQQEAEEAVKEQQKKQQQEAMEEKEEDKLAVPGSPLDADKDRQEDAMFPQRDQVRGVCMKGWLSKRLPGMDRLATSKLNNGFASWKGHWSCDASDGRKSCQKLEKNEKDHWKRCDSSQHMEFEGQDKILGPVSSVAENPEVMPPSSMHCLEENDAMLKKSEIPTLEKDELPLKYEFSSHPKSRENLTSVEDYRSQVFDVEVENAGLLLQNETFGGYSEPGCNSKANLCGDNNIDSRARATKSSSDTVQDMVIGPLPRDCLVEDSNGGQNSRIKIMQSEIESRDNVKQMTSRTRSLSPGAEIKDGNKHPRIICDFFAKGWCIRGSSCSFLHIKDTGANIDQEAEADLVTTHQKRQLKVEEGVRENVERSRMNQQEATPSWHPSQEKQKFPLRDNLVPENRFPFSASDNYFSSNLSLTSTRADGMATLRNQHMYKGYTSTLLSHSPNSSLVSQFPASSMPLSQQILAQSGRSLSFSNVDSKKFLNTDKEYLTSKSTFSGSGSGSGREDFSLVNLSRVPSYPAGYKSKICSYDWEPSVPFRPSFFITSMNVSSPGDLYDPLRDSIEIPNIGDGSLKASLLIHGSNIQASSQVRTYGDSAVVGKHMANLNDDKSSVSSHNKFCENEPNKNCLPREKDCLPPETEITSGTYVHYQGKMGMGQHTFEVADNKKKERDLTECDARCHGEGSGRKKKRVDRDKKNHEMDVDFQMDGSMQKESKALKFFRAVLIDHVKELLKPAWHEGRLSKDTHIMIVKKSVDKVVNTLEPHQIPTIDTAKQYVSSSQVKIAKLVNGYVNKYGKS
ncbi:hypothetical protein JHK87_037066 [Glycine soja]|nr:hypothetical protein JHK87_037066 [Glycine soja]